MSDNTASMADDIDRVDTKEMRAAADILRDSLSDASFPGIHAAEEATDAVCEAIAFIRSAADELDGLRNDQRALIAQRDGARAGRDDEIAAHAETREQLENLTATLSDFRQLEDSFIAEQNAHAETCAKLKSAEQLAVDVTARLASAEGVIRMASDRHPRWRFAKQEHFDRYGGGS